MSTVMTWIRWIDRVLDDFIIQGKRPWWVWPSFMVVLATVSGTMAFALFPGVDNQLMIFNPFRWAAVPWGSECGFRLATGFPCPQCGMTRSWVYLVRGDVWSSLLYNPAGSLLLAWILVGGFLGTVRLALRNSHALIVPRWAAFAWVMVWLAVPYFGTFSSRMLSLNYLPRLGDPNIGEEAAPEPADADEVPTVIP